MKTFKRSLALVLAVILLATTFSIAASAISVSQIKFTDWDYGKIYPQNATFTKYATTTTLYGTYDYLNFSVSKTNPDVYFFYELYADKNFTKLVASDYDKGDRKDKRWSSLLKIKNFKAGTYYGLAYAAYVNHDTASVDINSIVDFKVVVNKTTAFNKQVVLPRAIAHTANGPKITWFKHSAAATQYIIYRRQINGTSWTRVGTVKAPTLSFTDKSVKSLSGEYVYTIKAVNSKGVASRYHYNGLYIKYASTPIVKTAVTSDNSIQVSWDKQTLYPYSYVYRREVGSSWKLLGERYNSNSYIDKNAEAGKTYEYTVRRGSSSPVSGYIASKPLTLVGAPILKDITEENGKPLVQWSAVEGAIAYTIYRKALDSKESWTNLGKVNANTTSFVDETADATAFYAYTVRSEGEAARGSYDSIGKAYVKLSAPQNAVFAYKTDNIYAEIFNTNVTLKRVPYATGYNFYLKDSTGNWTNIASTSYLSASIKLPSGENTIAITATRKNGDNVIETNPDDAVYTFWYYDKSGISATNDTDNIQVSWSFDADSYNLYRRLKDETEFRLLAGGLTEKTYNDISAERDVYYVYCVKGVYNGVEQTERLVNITRCNPTVPADKEITYQKTFFQANEADGPIRTLLTFNGLTEKDILYVYNKDKNKFVQTQNKYIIPSDTQIGDEIRFAVSFNVDGHRTPLEEYTLTYEHTSLPREFTTAIKNTEKYHYTTWNAVDGAVKYELVKATSNHQGYSVEKTYLTLAADGRTSFTGRLNNTELQYLGSGYYDMICLIVYFENGDIFVDILDPKYVPTPTNLKTTRLSDTRVYLSWDTSSQYNNYNIYRKEGNGSWVKIATLRDYDNFYCVDNKAKKGVAYTYTVSRFRDDGIVSGYNSKGVTCSTKPK